MLLFLKIILCLIMLVTVIGAVAEDDATKVMSLTSLCIVAMVSLTVMVVWV